MALVPALLPAPVASPPLAARGTCAAGAAEMSLTLPSAEQRAMDTREEEEQARANALLATATLPGGGLSGKAWRASCTLRRSHWLCVACDIAHVPSALECYQCGALSALVLSNSAAVVAQRREEAIESSAYGRGLRFGRDRQQHVGVPASVGRWADADFDEQVEATVDSIGRPLDNSERRDFADTGVVDFDSYLAVVTRAELKVITKAEVQAFAASGKAHSLLKEYLGLMACVTEDGKQVSELSSTVKPVWEATGV